MATSSSSLWRFALNSHPIFDVLRENVECARQTENSRELLAVKDSDIFIWDQDNAHLLTTNLKNLLDSDDSQRNHVYQTLFSTNPPRFQVNRIKINLTGSHVALIGNHGVSVLELPRRWGKYADFEGGKPRITCRTVTIAERFFISHSSTCVLQASWYPGSETDTHLIVLTSDNVLRVYETSDPQNVCQVYSLGESHTASEYDEVLGEIAVSFDFGQPIEIQSKSESRREKTEDPALIYPVYILRGNGDIYYLPVVVSDQSTVRHTVQGPLTMHPPAEDNYGLDACNIICLESSPPVLVIATSSGNLYHCIVLGKGDDDSDDTLSWSDASYRREAELSLYVYENVEVELSLSLDDVDEDMTFPITLHKDPSSAERYHCSHSAGVHSIALTWLPKLQDLCYSEDDNSLLEFSQDQACRAEHLVCTRPVADSVPAPIQGFCIVSDKLLGVTLLCLTSTIECIALPLINTYSSSMPLLSSMSSHAVKGRSPLGKLHSEPFDRRIRMILQRNTSNPVLKSHPQTEMSQQQCLQILSRATQVFREEYILKQETAREEIAKRVQVLRDQKEQQLIELRDFEDERDEIKGKAEEIADKLEDAKDTQEQLLHRIETVLRNLESRLPALSDAEKNMKKEVSTMGERLKHLKNSLQQVKTKEEYQRRQISHSGQTKKLGSMSPSQIKQVRTILREESDKISGLVKQVNSLKVIAGD
ncbi:nucleoporin 88-like isoform X1 [Glandiceps talaboti]